VATKGLTAYVKWKSVEALENKGEISERIRLQSDTREETLGLRDVTQVLESEKAGDTRRFL
jgi:hypothetical protein